MIAKTAAGLILGITGGLLMFFGLAWGGYAIFVALTAPFGIAWAAATTAFIFLFVPVIVIIVAIAARKPKPKLEGNAAIMSALASVARDKPVLALLAAGLFGMADVLMNRWRRRKND
jgi:hypothetical protein